MNDVERIRLPMMLTFELDSDGICDVCISKDNRKVERIRIVRKNGQNVCCLKLCEACKKQFLSELLENAEIKSEEKRMKRIIEILMKRDGNTEKEAKARLEEVKDMLVECNYDADETELPKYIGKKVDWFHDLGPFEFSKEEYLQCVSQFRMLDRSPFQSVE